MYCKTIISAILVIIGNTLNTLHAQCSSIATSDSLALVDFYYATNGSNWLNNGGWLTAPINEWHGITVSSNACAIVEISLGHNQLSGTIPNLMLPQLEKLRLNNNQLTGTIPNFDNLPALEVLYLHNNTLTGALPNFQLPHLFRLELQNNTLSGTIPTFDGLPQLSILNLRYNAFTGDIPNFQLLNLMYCYLNDNELTGNMPNFDSLPILKSLHLQNNQLTGIVPSFEHLVSLSNLKICPNLMWGAIPALAIENVDWSCVQNAQVFGQTYYDVNGNCLKDDDEPVIPLANISNSDNSYLTFSKSDGHYNMILDAGTHTLNATPPNQLWQQTCPNPLNGHEIVLDNYNEPVEGVDFAFEPLVECPLLTVNLSTSLLRRCFQNTYTIHACNTGAIASDEAYVELFLPDAITPLESSIPYIINADGLLQFDVGILEVGACRSFTLTSLVSCDAVLGSTACVQANIYPNEYCGVLPTTWDGADLTVNGACMNNDTINFTIQNIGEDMISYSQYKMYEDDLLITVDAFILTAGETLELVYEATGAAIRVEVTQTAGHPYTDIAADVVELCGEEPFSLGFVLSQALPDNEPFLDKDCREIMDLYNPNSKSATPKGMFEDHYISETQALEYHIRFQNTGNDTVFKVVVVDTLDTELLDISTLQLGVSSHPYIFKLRETNILTFIFDDILLPTNTTNELESHGFLNFKIEQRPINPLGTQLFNSAAIYLGCNEPIITNKSMHTIAELQDLYTTTLAVDLLEFTGRPTTTAVNLAWQTAWELNNAGFELQYSPNGQEFTTIAWIKGEGNSQRIQKYEYSHQNPNQGSNYYRLKQVDYDGKSTYSAVVNVPFNGQSWHIEIHPNPVSNSLQLSQFFNKQVSYQLYNTQGNVVTEGQFTAAQHWLNTEKLASGLYYLHLSDGKHVQTIKVIKE